MSKSKNTIRVFSFFILFSLVHFLFGKPQAYLQPAYNEPWLLIGTLSLIMGIGVVVIKKFQEYQQLRKEHQQLAEEKQSFEDLIAQKERAMATMAMASHEKNTILKDLEQKISFIESRMQDDMKKSLRDMRKTIASICTLDESWDSFIHRFDNVHPQFFENLKRENPDLTIEDLKLSAYVKIGMSNKEIACVTHLTLGSVKSKVNRLKKKLNIGPEDSFREYILMYG